jgi:hypothetical protein
MLDAKGVEANHHGRAGLCPALSCDWRFLPKLGPLRHSARGPSFFVSLETFVCHADSDSFRQILSTNGCALHNSCANRCDSVIYGSGLAGAGRGL